MSEMDQSEKFSEGCEDMGGTVALSVSASSGAVGPMESGPRMRRTSRCSGSSAREILRSSLRILEREPLEM